MNYLNEFNKVQKEEYRNTAMLGSVMILLTGCLLEGKIYDLKRNFYSSQLSENFKYQKIVNRLRTKFLQWRERTLNSQSEKTRDLIEWASIGAIEKMVIFENSIINKLFSKKVDNAKVYAYQIICANICEFILDITKVFHLRRDSAPIELQSCLSQLMRELPDTNLHMKILKILRKIYFLILVQSWEKFMK